MRAKRPWETYRKPGPLSTSMRLCSKNIARREWEKLMRSYLASAPIPCISLCRLRATQKILRDLEKSSIDARKNIIFIVSFGTSRLHAGGIFLAYSVIDSLRHGISQDRKRESNQGNNHADHPVAHRNLIGRPAERLKVVVQRRNKK